MNTIAAFWTGSTGKEQTGTGTGIGLATVQRIARWYGGKAGVEETPGDGATFTVELIISPPPKWR